MREALTIFFALLGLGLFVAGDVLWLVRRAQGKPLNLRFTGMLVFAGVAIFLFAAVVLRPA
jgi:O-antigen ligase